MRRRIPVVAATLAMAAALGLAACSDDDTDTATSNATETTNSAPETTSPAASGAAEGTEPADADPQAPSGGCTTTGTIGDERLTDVPTEPVEAGFIASLDDGTELSFGDGSTGPGKPYLQVSGPGGVWIGPASVDPGTGASASGALDSDLGGDALQVDLVVTC